ncbi:uncharacterized protein M421DRAFT_75262, partial [Didymella exigua CBS 183.55]
TLTVKEGQRIAALKEFGARGDGKKSKKRVRAERGKRGKRHCKCCGETGHNSRTCKKDVVDVSN